MPLILPFRLLVGAVAFLSGSLALAQSMPLAVLKTATTPLSAEFLGSFGRAKHEALTCSADPDVVYPNEAVTVKATAAGFGKEPHLTYLWTVPGGAHPGHESVVTIPAGLGPGMYSVTVGVAKNGHKKAKAECATSFTVRAYEPPTLSCSVAPEKVTAGVAVVVTAVGRSAQGRALTYTYSASAGAVTGDGASAKLDTTGAVAGSSITVKCGVTDDLGKGAVATAKVAVAEVAPAPAAVEAPPVKPEAPPEVAHEEKLCTILFERDRKRPVRVDNEAKACLDSVALSKSREVLSKLVLVGTYTHQEGANAGAERALHAKEYLVQEKGIDVDSIQTMVKASEAKSVESVLLPGDAVFEDEGAMDFDPGSVRLHGEAYGKRGKGVGEKQGK